MTFVTTWLVLMTTGAGRMADQLVVLKLVLASRLNPAAFVGQSRRTFPAEPGATVNWGRGGAVNPLPVRMAVANCTRLLSYPEMNRDGRNNHNAKFSGPRFSGRKGIALQHGIDLVGRHYLPPCLEVSPETVRLVGRCGYL